MALHRGTVPRPAVDNPQLERHGHRGEPGAGRAAGAAEEPAGRRPVPAEVAYQLIRDELLLDGSARLNLATFVTTWMEPQARVLMAECVDKNMIDKDEYPQTAELERRCVAMLADLWNAPAPNERPAARPPAPARRACWRAWPCSGGGRRG